MDCASPQSLEALAPGILQGLTILQLLMPLQAPGQHQLGPMLMRCLEDHDGFGGLLVVQAESKNPCRRFLGAPVSHDLDVLVLRFQQELRLRRRPLRVWKQRQASDRLQDLSNAQELLMHPRTIPVNSMDQLGVQVLEEHHSHLAPDGLPLIGPVLLPRQGLVLGDVEDRRGTA